MTMRWMLVLVAFGATGCSWSRFDDVGKDSPVVLLKKPDKMHGGFGSTIAAAYVPKDDTTPASSRIIVGGANGKNIAAMFDLGTGTNPIVDSSDTGSCTEDGCFLGTELAGLGTTNFGAVSGPENLCFVFGFASIPDPAVPKSVAGLQGRCADGTEYVLPVPDSVLRQTIMGEVVGQPDAPEATLVLATDKDQGPALIAGAKDQKLAWFYKPLKGLPIALVAPGTPEQGFGTTVASVRLGTGPTAARVMAVGAPDVGHVWLFSGDTGAPVGCLGGPSGFGRTLSSGHVDGDDVDELIIADTTNVTVISGRALAGLTPSNDITCTLAALPPKSILASFSCGSRGTITGCPGNFGAAIDVGDLDGDGDGEVLVGVPDMEVRGTGSAGAVLVYDMEGTNPLQITDELFLSSADDGDQLGSTLVAAHIDKRDVVVAGAPGSGRVGVFYCSTLLPGSTDPRCQ